MEQEEAQDYVVDAGRVVIDKYAMSPDDIESHFETINPVVLFGYMSDPRSKYGNSYWCQMKEDNILVMYRINETSDYNKYAAFINNEFIEEIKISSMGNEKEKGKKFYEFAEWYDKISSEGNNNG